METEEDFKQWQEHVKNTKPIQLDPKKRAFECFKVAAEADVTEAAYKLGDMYKHGTGCTENAAEAFKWYARAANLCEQQDEVPVIAGSVALRLADCFEEGFGCTQSFKDALKWYKQAVLGLDVAVRAGERWYSKALRGARDGAARCKQELGL